VPERRQLLDVVLRAQRLDRRVVRRAPVPEDLQQLLEVARVVRGGPAWKNILAGSPVGFANAWGQPGGTTTTVPGVARTTRLPELDSHFCQLSGVRTRGSKASTSGSPSST
jgi:hypothetical protein